MHWAGTDDDYVHYLIAFCYYRKDDIDTAKKFVEQAIALFPRNAGYFALLEYLFSKRNYADALNAANKGLYENRKTLAAPTPEVRHCFG